jgi:hypothetical protein
MPAFRRYQGHSGHQTLPILASVSLRLLYCRFIDSSVAASPLMPSRTSPPCGMAGAIFRLHSAERGSQKGGKVMEATKPADGATVGLSYAELRDRFVTVT